MSISKGTIVEVFEDPISKTKKEGNARVVGRVDVDLYQVNFIGDDPEMIVHRYIVEDQISADAVVERQSAQ